MELIVFKKGLGITTKIPLNSQTLKEKRLPVKIQAQVNNLVHKRKRGTENNLVKKVLPPRNPMNSIPILKIPILKIHQKDPILTINIKTKTKA